MNDGTDLTARRLARNPIAIVGMSGLFPMAPDHRSFWQNIVDGVDCSQDVPDTHWSLDDYHDPDPDAPDRTYARRGAFIPDVAFDPLEWGLPPNHLEVTSTLQLLSLGVARDLLADAGAPGSSWYDPERTGVVLGVTGPVPLMHPLAARLSTPVLRRAVQACGLSERDAEEISAKYTAAFAPWEENSFPGLLPNVVAGRIAHRFNLGGMNSTVDAACAASLSAVRVAVAELLDGRADLMITGGCDTENTIFIYMCFSKVGALSKGNRVRPFDDAADGTLLGEGIGMLALKRLADAERDGDRIYAVIRGIGSSSDGRSSGIYAPLAAGQRRALDRAYEDAECSPASVELFEAHATGTAVGDRTELSALRDLLTDATDERRFAALGSVKSQIGHTKGAAGTASLMKLAHALYHRTLPPTINVDTPNRAVDFTDAPFYVNTRTRPWILDPTRPRRRAAASAMGFGGTNFHVVLEEAGDRAAVRNLHRTARAHLWSAPDPEALLAKLRAGEPSTDGGPVPPDHARIGFAATDDATAEDLRNLAEQQLAANPQAQAFSHPKGVFYRRAADPDLKVAALFAGQGSQYLDMGADAAVHVPPVGAAFDAANAAFADAPARLAPIVFPPPVFDPAQRQEQETALRRTEHAQPAIGALAAGQFAFLREVGLRPSGFLGHSFGELTALWASGALRDADFFRLARARGEAMAPHPESGDDPGAMAAVQADREQVTAILADFPDVVVCNHNAPDQVAVGGGTAAVDAVIEACRARGLTARRLPVSAAFHTRYVAHAVERFRAAVEQTEIGAPTGTVHANSPGGGYGADVEANRRTLAEQLLRPVEFVAGLEALRADGFTVFVEFGPKQVLTQLVRRTLGDTDVVAIPTDTGPLGDGDLALKQAAVRLAVLGAPITAVNRYDAPPTPVREPGRMAVTIRGAEYVPETRLAAYRATLDNGYRAGAATPALAAATPDVPTAQQPAAAAPDSRPTPNKPQPPAIVAAPAPTTPAAPAAVAASAPVDGVAEALHQHISLHTRYLEGQLAVAESLVAVLQDRQDGTQADAWLSDAVAGVRDQSIAISDAHVRANTILAGLAALGAPLPPHAATALTGTPTPAIPHHPSAPALGSGIAATPAAPDPMATLTPWPTTPTPSPNGHHSPPTPPSAVPAHAVNGAIPTTPDAPSGTTESPPPVAADASVASVVLDVVAERTGYPVEMLDSGMDLESDLGVDSIKRVQILGSLQERFPGVEAAGPERLAEMRTPAHIAEYIAGEISGSDGPSGVAASVASGSVAAVVLEVVAERTGYPVEMLDSGMDLESDLGVDSIKRVQILGSLQERFPGVEAAGPERLAEMRTPAHIADYILGELDEPDGVSVIDASAVAAPSLSAASVAAAVLDVVAERTGYPVAMLDVGMDLESDLGVDSIKRVQILGSLQERFPGVEAAGPERLAEMRTPAHIAAYIEGELGAATAPSAGEQTAVEPDVDDDHGGLPVQPVRLVRIPAVDPREDAYRAGSVALLVEDGAAEGDAAALADALRARGWTVHRLDLADTTNGGNGDDAGGITGWDGDGLDRRLAQAFAGLDSLDLCAYLPGVGAASDGVAWNRAVRALGTAVLVAKHAHGPLTTLQRPHRAAFVTVTRIDGGLGHRGTAPAEVALLGGVGGVVKTLVREAPTLFARALDLAPAIAPEVAAGAVADELVDAAVDTLEVGRDADGTRWTVVPGPYGRGGNGRDAQSAGDAASGNGIHGADGPSTEVPPLSADDVVLVTGGGRGVTAHCVRALARAVPCEFLLLGRTKPADEPAWAVGVPDDELRAAAISGLRAGRKKAPTPRQVDAAHREEAARREIRATLAAVADAGGRARYIAVDVANAAATAKALAADAGRVTAVVHGAGALADALVSAKTPDAVRTVLAPKLDGLHAVLAALGDAPVRHLVLFGSVAGLLGNTGQSDYAAANEALARLAARRSHQDAAPQVTTVAWGAWDGGMVTSELREVFLARGVRLLPPDDGAAVLVGLLTGRRPATPYVLVGEAEALSRGGGADGSGRPAPAAFTARRGLGELAAHPVIRAHRIGGHAVLPATFALGWMVHTVERAHPGLRVVEARGFEVRKGIVFDDGPTSPTPGTRYRVEVAPQDDAARGGADGRVLVRVTVRGDGPSDTLVPVHYTADLLLASAPDAAPVVAGLPGPLGGDGPEDGLVLYRDAVQFHGPRLQGMRRILADSRDRLVLECHIPDDAVAAGAFAGALHSPVLADVILQGPPVLGHRLLGGACLPLAVERIEYFAPLPDDRPFAVVLEPGRRGAAELSVTATACDAAGRVLQRFTGVSVVATPDLGAKFAEAVAAWQAEETA